MRFVLVPLVAAAALASSSAGARPEYVDFIPSAPVDGKCGTCHVDSMGQGERNAFGVDVEATLDDDGPDWSKLFCTDSDGDGKTNGQELGDPCGAWQPGESPLRTEPLSAPGDADDTVDIDDAHTCDGDAPPECSSPAAQAAGCTATGSSSALGVLALFLLGKKLRTPASGSTRRRCRRCPDRCPRDRASRPRSTPNNRPCRRS